MVNNLLNGQQVDLISWSDSGSIPLAGFLRDDPDLEQPGRARYRRRARSTPPGRRASADLSYQVGFRLDTNGFWIQQGTGVSLSFDLDAGIQGQVEIFGIPLAKAGGDIGFDITPYVSLAPDPYSNVPGRDYVSDLMAFGSNLPQDFVDALSEGLEGSLTGTLYASIDLLFVHFGASFTINIPVFNIEHDPAWPGGSNGAGGSTPRWPPRRAANGALAFQGTSGNDNLALSGGQNGSMTITWKGHKSPIPGNNGPDSMTLPNAMYSAPVSSFSFYGNGGSDQLTTGQDFNIPIDASAVPQAGTGNAESSAVYFEGGDASNTLVGGTGNAILVGGGGSAYISAGSGNDLIFGGQGNSTIVGGGGNDSIYGGPGDNVIFGGSGAYYIEGGGGNDTIYGGQGHAEMEKGVLTYPIIHGGDGNATIIDMSAATANQDHYPTTGSVATAFSGFGVDPYNSTSIGPTADDAYPSQIYGDGGIDTIYGGGGGDMIVAGSGSSVIYGGAGNDSIRGRARPGYDLRRPRQQYDRGGVGADTTLWRGWLRRGQPVCTREQGKQPPDRWRSQQPDLRRQHGQQHPPGRQRQRHALRRLGRRLPGWRSRPGRPLRRAGTRHPRREFQPGRRHGPGHASTAAAAMTRCCFRARRTRTI